MKPIPQAQVTRSQTAFARLIAADARWPSGTPERPTYTPERVIDGVRLVGKVVTHAKQARTGRRGSFHACELWELAPGETAPAPFVLPGSVDADPPEPAEAPTERMRTSDAGLAFVVRHEGAVLFVYDDATSNRWGPGASGNPTIGVGHVVLPGEDFSAGITHEQAIELLRRDIAIAEAAVNRLGVELAQHEFDALVSFTFNTGVGALATSELAHKLKSGDRQGAAAEFMDWTRSGSDPKRLESRRRAERALFLGAEVAFPADGSDLESLRDVQRALNRLGWAPLLLEDGMVGPKTAAAIRSFQATHGLTADGIVGPKTRAAIARALVARADASA